LPQATDAKPRAKAKKKKPDPLTARLTVVPERPYPPTPRAALPHLLRRRRAVVPICWMVMDATRLPNAAASSRLAPAATAQADARAWYCPGPDDIDGPATG